MANKRMFSIDVVDTDNFWICQYQHRLYIFILE